MSNLDKTLDKVEKGANRLQIGCITIFVNLFLGAFCLWGAYAAVVANRLETNGVTTEGIVVGLDESDNEGSTVYSPIVEYEVNGRRYTIDGGIASSPPAYDVGERVEVLYDKADPSTAQINKWSERWLFPIMIIPAMILTALILNFFMLRAWRRGESIDD